MQLNESVRQRLAQDYQFAADQMRARSDLRSKMYFFSVFYGEANRALNADWNSDIALLHLVVQSAHQAMIARIGSPPLGLSLPGLPKNFAEALTELSGQLASLFQTPEVNDEELHRILARLAKLAYATTGNGYYLYLKGALKV